MKHRFTYFSLALLFLGLTSFTTGPDVNGAPEWKIDKNHSSISFTINHFFTPVHGSFDVFEGKVIFDPEDPGSCSAEFTVDLTSINTKNQKRDGHLQSEDFFNTKKWSTMKFVSEKFESIGEGKYMVHGKLTIRDVTKDVTIQLDLLGIMDHPMRKGTRIASFKSEFTLDRNDYGVGSGDWVATTVVGDEVTVSLSFEVNRQV